ncbi:MAG: AAA family ATPase [Eubacterium sp.]|nr:AAA family ATPase [Eubacterium sp.]MCI8918645.1 AAA family ATPase [Eubacterium sp.]
MGIYVNPDNTAFEMSRFSDIYVDKSMLISKMNAVYRTEKRYICVSRPRRFGKSMAANMLLAYYSCGCDSKDLFSGLRIENDRSYQKHLNKHNVIRLDIQKFLFQKSHLNIFIDKIQEVVIKELRKEFGDCFEINEYGLPGVLEQIYGHTKKGFIFIIDEWDCVFRLAKEQKEVQEAYLGFLRGLFKGQDYVELAYMTGILPIKKYGEHSAVNIFKEYSMLDTGRLAGDFGFTEHEVCSLCETYGVDYAEAEKWYDGYLLGGMHIYNPMAITELMESGEFKSYWTGTETYEALKVYIDMNFDGLKEAVAAMLGNARCRVNTRKFQNDMTSFQTKDDVLTLLVHLGYLSCDRAAGEVFIPNQEIAYEFLNAADGSGWDGLVKAVNRSAELLENTWKLNGSAVAEGIAIVHNETASMLKYKDENSLTCTVLMAYYSAKIYYVNPVMEFPSGKGFADVVYLPKRNVDKPALIIELKWNKSVQGAIAQIKEKEYSAWLEGYTGEILLVGINFDEKKGHTCVIEKLVKL